MITNTSTDDIFKDKKELIRNELIRMMDSSIENSPEYQKGYNKAIADAQEIIKELANNSPTKLYNLKGDWTDTLISYKEILEALKKSSQDGGK